MKLFNIKARKPVNTVTNNPSDEATSHQEPIGHLHENLRHWGWFKPSDR